MSRKIFIGTEENQFIPQQVLIYSIKQTLSVEADIVPATQSAARVGGTNFGFVRFEVPSLCDFKGRAVYMDADQLVFSDMKDLFEQLDGDCAVACVQEPEGSFGEKVLGPGNQTSVMVLDCEKLKDWDPATMFDNVVPNRAELKEGQIHYRDFMKLDGMDPKRIQALDPRWNHFNIVREDTKLVHFSHVRSQPWKNPRHPLTELWTDWLLRAVKAGFISRYRLWREISKGHLDRHFVKHILPFSRAA